jgi:hypothetical protein
MEDPSSGNSESSNPNSFQFSDITTKGYVISRRCTTGKERLPFQRGVPMACMLVDFASETLKRNVGFVAYLPTDMGKEGPLRSLYLLHGLHGDMTSWLVNSRVAFYAREKGICCFFPMGRTCSMRTVPSPGTGTVPSSARTGIVHPKDVSSLDAA